MATETPASSDLLHAPAHLAIQEALEQYYEQFFRMPIPAPGIKFIDPLPTNPTPEEKALYLAHYTRQQCENGSAALLDYIQRIYPDLFDSHTMAIVVSMKNPSKRFRDFPDDNYTSYGIVQDHDGCWHTFTGEYDPEGLIPPTKNLDILLREIEKREGGVWPNGDFVEQGLPLQQMPPIVEQIPENNVYYKMRLTFAGTYTEHGVTRQGFIPRDLPENGQYKGRVREVYFRRIGETPRMKMLIF